MRKVTKTYTVYNFDELSEEAKAVAIAHEVDSYELDDDIMESLEGFIERASLNMSKKKHDIFYSLDRCQGDGCCIDFKESFTVEEIKSIMLFDMGLDVGSKYDILDGTEMEVVLRHDSNMYYHSNSMSNTVYGIYGEEDNIRTLAYNLAQLFHDAIINLCQGMGSFAYDYIEEEHSDESITERLEGFGYEYLEDGKIA